MTPAEIIDELNKIGTGMGGTKVVPNLLIAEIITKLSGPFLLPTEACNNPKCWCYTWKHIDADE